MKPATIRPALLAVAGACTLSSCTDGRLVPVASPALAAAQPAVRLLPTGAAYLASAPNLRTLAAVAGASGGATRLNGTGPFTIFAPSDGAFARMSPTARTALIQPENRDISNRLLFYHVVAGTLTTAELRARVTAGNGTAALASIEGELLTVTLTQGQLTLNDADGDRSYIETGDIAQSNGMVHIVNGVLVPRLR